MKIIKENPTSWKLLIGKRYRSRQRVPENTTEISHGVPGHRAHREFRSVHNFVFEGVLIPGFYSADGSFLLELDSGTSIRMRHAQVFKLLEALVTGKVKVDKKRKGFSGIFTFTNQSGAISLMVYDEETKKDKPGKKTRAKNSNG